MSDIKMEGQEPVAAAPAITNEDVKIEPEIVAPAPIESETTTATEPEIKQEKMDEAEVNTEVKEEKTDSDIKSEIKEEKVETTNGDVKMEDEDEKKNKDKKFDYDEPRFYDNGVLKTNANEVHGKNNSKYDASILPPSEDAGLIRRQVEFYFGDSNLPTDAFLMKESGGAENKPISIVTIHKFKRMQRFQPYSVVIDALKQSKFLVVEGEEGKETVRRKKAFDPSAKSPKAKLEARSVYMKGFGDEEPSSQFDIEAFVANYGEVNSVRLRRTEERLFKGSVFIEFADEETAQKFLALDPKPQWKGKHVLEIKSKTQYMEEKNEEIRNGTLVPGQHRGRGGFKSRGRGGRGGGGGDFKKERDGEKDGDRDPNDWKKRRENDRENGFRGGRGRGDRGRGDRGRGGRGRGDRKDNDRRGGRNDRGPRGNDRNKERSEKNGDDKEVKVEKSTESAEAPANDKKRAREDDGGAEEHQNKKVDVKPEVATQA
ncbi:hypothetical protein SBOR_9330 [Sclerotinia borealis F-4128]|uniref:La domain-containing protein n=1 Tax=Sclerotinia borealis (strain F-4128) TaxID=1432307 RepID=W9C6S9_SCLBF|nr:hypothetical protein SBOR_9330 [Sclerotinia borealis F-4128]